MLIEAFDKDAVEEVKYEVWMQIDRYTLQTLLLKVDKFVEEFCDRLNKLKTQDYILK